MYGLSIYEIKKNMSPRSIFHNLTWKFLAFYKFSEKKTQVLNIKLKYLKSLSSFFNLILIIAHDLKLSRKCHNLFVFPGHVKILHDIVW